MPKEKSSAVNHRQDLLIFAYCCLLLFWSICQAENIAELYSHDALSIQYGNGKEFLTDFVHFYIAGTIAGSADRKEIYNPKIQSAGLRPSSKGIDTTVELLYATCADALRAHDSLCANCRLILHIWFGTS